MWNHYTISIQGFSDTQEVIPEIGASYTSVTDSEKKTKSALWRIMPQTQRQRLIVSNKFICW